MTETIKTLSVGLIVGVTIGFVVGFFVRAFLEEKRYEAEKVLAWFLAFIFIAWHLISGLGLFGIGEPPAVFDVISGGAVGFVLGEKFFNYVATAIVAAIRK